MESHLGRGSSQAPSVAYFSMEFGIEPEIPTYSGGLGVLAGDTIRAAADLGLPFVGISLLHRKGYFRQHLDRTGNQAESDLDWSPEEVLQSLPSRAMITIAGRQVQIRAWRYTVRGQFGHSVPIYFLDTDFAENSPEDRRLTDLLYRGDDYYRLCQEIVLGIGGVAMLRALGYKQIQAYHMNEGHSAFIAVALVAEQTWGRSLLSASSADVEAVRQRCVFTTHTPVSAGHDRFPVDMVRHALGQVQTDFLLRANCCPDGCLNMTELALRFSRYVNGVSMRHEKTSRTMFCDHPIDSVTNGVHATTWTSEPFQRLYDRFIPEWRRDNLYLRYAIGIPREEIRQAHAEAKARLLAEIDRRTGRALDAGILTIGFARRATAYKRPDLLFHDMERLKSIAGKAGPFQIVYGGKAHPRDEEGKNLIRRVFHAAGVLQDALTVVYLEEYDMALGKILCSGVDLWLNTPQKSLEASGTSGMKAALNGVPSLSVVDGWWVEGHVENITGWAIGNNWRIESTLEAETESLYDKLENVILPLFYKQPQEYARIMRSAIALNGSYFNAQRMLTQYLYNAYNRAGFPGSNGDGAMPAEALPFEAPTYFEPTENFI